MDPSLVLRKTEKGQGELKTRTHKLSPAMRMMLILVDGRTDVGGLHKKVPSLKEMEECLVALLKEGFISAGNEDSTDTITKIVDTGRDNPATRIKWDIVEMVSEVLGEEFGQRATKRFTLIPDKPDDLKEALNECCQFISLTIDESKSKIVEQRGAEMLSEIEI